MLPPVSKAVLSANPQFEALYNNLCVSKLESDGTTRLDEKKSIEQRVFEQEIKQARQRAVQHDLLVHYLTVVSEDAELSSEAQESVRIAAAILDGHFASEDAAIIHDAVQSFQKDLPKTATLVARRLQNDIDTIHQLVSPMATSSAQDALEVIEHRIDALRQSRSSTVELRSLLADQAAQVHADHRQLIEACVQILERTVHGSESRAFKAKADYLAVVAEGMSKKVRIQQNQLLPIIDTPEAQSQLRMALREMKVTEQDLQEQCTKSEARLAALQYELGRPGEELSSIIAETRMLEAELQLLRK